MSSGYWGPVAPSVEAAQIDGACSGDVLEPGLGGARLAELSAWRGPADGFDADRRSAGITARKVY